MLDRNCIEGTDRLFIFAMIYEMLWLRWIPFTAHVTHITCS